MDKQEDKKPDNNRKYLKYGLLGLILLAIMFGSFKGGKYRSDKFWEREMKQEEEEKALIEKERDSFYGLYESTIEQADLIRFENDDLRRRNEQLYYEIRKKAREIIVYRDTAFMSNARYISNSTDRFYKAGDSIR